MCIWGPFVEIKYTHYGLRDENRGRKEMEKHFRIGVQVGSFYIYDIWSFPLDKYVIYVNLHYHIRYDIC